LLPPGGHSQQFQQHAPNYTGRGLNSTALCAKQSLGALNRSLEADVKESEGTRWVKSHPAKSSQQPEASFASCDGDMQGEA
jgi:hypothetical protein